MTRFDGESGGSKDVRRGLGLVAALALALVWAPMVEASPTRADLTVAKLVDPPARVAAGSAVTVAHRVRNRGRRGARATTVGFWLSRDRRRGRSDVRLAGAAKVRGLRSRRSTSARRRVTVPPATAPGLYHLIACVDPSRRVRESKESNNCRASRRKVRVTAARAAPPAPAVPAAPPAASAPAPSRTPGSYPLAAAPRSVSPTLQTDRATTTTYYGLAQTLTAQAADGTKFSLALPQGALPGPVDITLTPVGAVGGSPLSGGLVGAVEIKPHGVTLLKPGVLTIDPPGDTPVSQQTGFYFHGPGEDFHLYPLAMGSELKLNLTHFSTPGVGLASDADRQAAASTPPARTQAQIAQAISELLREERERQINGGPDTSEQTTSAVIDEMAAYYRDVVDPTAHAAETSDAAMERGVSELLGWLRQLELLGAADDPRVKAQADGVFGRIVTIFRNAIDRAAARCQDHNLDDIVRLIKLARIAALLGTDLGDQALAEVFACAQFEVRFDSRIHGQRSGPLPEGSGTYTLAQDFRVASTVQADLTSMMVIRGEAPLAHQGSTYAYHPSYTCTDAPPYEPKVTLVGTTPGKLDVMLQFDLQLREPQTPPPPAYNLRVWPVQEFGVKETYEHLSGSCGSSQYTSQHIESDRWRQYFDRFHLDEFLTRFTGFSAGSGAVIGTKSYNRTDYDVTEATKIDVVHTPE